MSDEHRHMGHFSEGQHEHHDAESDRVGSFADGQRRDDQDEPVPHAGHFSEGQERSAHDAAKDVEGSFDS
jgi:hypothetical protein